MIKSITNFLIIFFIFQQLKSQISQIDQNGYNTFCDETLHLLLSLIGSAFRQEHRCDIEVLIFNLNCSDFVVFMPEST